MSKISLVPHALQAPLSPSTSGFYEHQIDYKGRFSIPAEYRKHCGSNGKSVFILARRLGNYNVLGAFPENPYLNVDAADDAFYGVYSAQLAIDKQGRILLKNEMLRKLAGIDPSRDSTVIITGSHGTDPGRPVCYIMGPKRWEAYDNDRKRARRMAKRSQSRPRSIA